MKKPVITFDGGKAGDIELDDAIYGLEPRGDILARVVQWQLNKRREGTRKTLTRGEINRTTKKMYKQKGTGGARHGAKTAPQFRGGGKAFGPVVRSHAHDLPKKVRALGLKHALSAKARADNLVVLSDIAAGEPKTKALKLRFDKLGLASVLVVGGATLDDNFRFAARGLPEVDVLPVQGINVYDILRREKLVLTKAAIEALEARLK